MESNGGDARIGAHVRAIANRPDSESKRFIASMLGRYWPGGSSDRSERAALEWVRRWGPQPVAHVTPACSCAIGRCRLCN
ncbi:MAG: hypothetical protein QOI89_1937 [Solirubrobacteraceae bacterium]|jgi:hypothetical protein|nr:hypothetical protein [Solirubrobacteraceae bacterium]